MRQAHTESTGDLLARIAELEALITEDKMNMFYRIKKQEARIAELEAQLRVLGDAA